MAPEWLLGGLVHPCNCQICFNWLFITFSVWQMWLSSLSNVTVYYGLFHCQVRLISLFTDGITTTLATLSWLVVVTFQYGWCNWPVRLQITEEWPCITAQSRLTENNLPYLLCKGRHACKGRTYLHSLVLSRW